MNQWVLLLFAFSQLFVGATCILYPTKVIHILYGRSNTKERPEINQSIPRFGSYTDKFNEFLRLASEDPDLLNDRFPGYINIIRSIGFVALVIFMGTICSIFS